jgi:hypothetical protein
MALQQLLLQQMVQSCHDGNALLHCACICERGNASCVTCFAAAHSPLLLLLPVLCLTHSRADIEPGQGMIADGRNSFVGRDCPKDTYGEHLSIWTVNYLYTHSGSSCCIF